MRRLNLDNIPIRNALKDVMGRLGLTYDTACKNIGISRTSLINFMLEGTNPNIRTIYKIKNFIKKNEE